MSEQDDMYVDVKVAYRLVELGLCADPDTIPYDADAAAEIDAEFDSWLAQHDADVAEKARAEGFDRGVEAYGLRIAQELLALLPQGARATNPYRQKPEEFIDEVSQEAC